MLSIVIPTYNEELYLPFLLRSIQAQEFKDFEVIVADAHSQDRTRDVAAAYGARVVDGGMPAVGRNRGADAAHGDILFFFDADAVLPDPWFLQGAMEEFAQRKLGIATCRIAPLEGGKIDKAMLEIYNYYVRVTASITPHAAGTCIMARRAVHEKIGGFDEAIKFAEDHDYAQRAGRQVKFGVLKRRLPTSMRRFEKDGRFKMAMKMLLVELYNRTRGPVTTDIFKYELGGQERGSSVATDATRGDRG